MTDAVCSICGRRVGVEERAVIQADRILHAGCVSDPSGKTSPTISPPAHRSPQYLVILQRGQTGLFRELHDRLAAAGHLQIMWDRRNGDRRSEIDTLANECRRAERRTIDLLGQLMGLLLAVPMDRDRHSTPAEPAPGTIEATGEPAQRQNI